MDFDADADEHERLAEGAQVEDGGNAAASGSGTGYPSDEELDVRPIHSQPVILLKLPAYVTNQWAAVKDRGVELGVMRVYDPIPGSGGKHEHEFSFRFPPTASSSSAGPAASSNGKAPTAGSSTDAARHLTFSSTMISGAERGKNRKYLMKEKDRIYDFFGKSRQHGKPRIFAAVNLEHNLVAKSTPQDQELFKELVELEAKRAEEQIKKTVMLSQAEQREIKRQAAMVKKGSYTNVNSRAAKRDNLVRADKSVLVDTMLQSCFKEYRYWTLKGMAERLQQPQGYVKEVLKDIAEYQAGGQYSGTYCLQEAFRKPRGADATSTTDEPAADRAPEDIKPTAEQLADLERRQRELELAEEDFGEDDDDDEEMEEVA